MTERFTRPRHDVIFRGLHLTPALLEALEQHGMLLEMSFREMCGENFLQLDLATPTPGAVQ